MFSPGTFTHFTDKGHMLQHLRAAVLATTSVLAFTAWGCSNTTEPTPDPAPNVLQVDTTSGHTGIDTAAIRVRLTALLRQAPRREDEIPFLARLHEVEEIGSEAIHHVLEKYTDGISILSDIHKAEMSQLEAMNILIDLLDIDDTNPDDSLGDFVDDEISAVWDDHVDHAKHTSKTEAIIAVARVFEFQLKEALQTREHVTTPVSRFAVDMIYAMNKNHFLALVKHLRSQGTNYIPFFLTKDEFDDESQDLYVILI
jgi:hypothetical protein